MAAGEIRGIDLGRVKAQAGVPAFFVSASITLQYSGTNGAVMGRVFGMSSDGSLGLYWALQPYAGFSYSESFWTTAANWTPIFTVGDFGAADDKVTIVMTSNRGNFTVPTFILKPSESRTINVRELLKQAKPFPEGVDYGGFRIYGSSTESKLVVKEHLIDPVMRLATPFYGSFVYCEAYDFDSTSYTIAVGGSASGTAILLMSDNTQEVAGNTFWSGNTSIATISGSFGYVTINGVASGSTNVYGQIRTTCDAQGDTCQFTAQSQAQVQCAVPTNYRQTAGYDSGSGSLHFEYAWDSSTGHLADLSACTVREYVSYPGGSPYNFPSPPFPAITVSNPTLGTSVSGTAGGQQDNHTTPGTFVTPFPIGNTSFTATQAYQYICPCSNGGNPVQLYPAIPGVINIVRTVSASSSSSGTFTITKSSVSSSKAVP